MRNADLLAELRKQRDDISMLAQKAAAAEERAFQMQSTIKELKAQLHVDMKELHNQLQDTKSRLKEVMRTGNTSNLRRETRHASKSQRSESTWCRSKINTPQIDALPDSGSTRTTAPADALA